MKRLNIIYLILLTFFLVSCNLACPSNNSNTEVSSLNFKSDKIIFGNIYDPLFPLTWPHNGTYIAYEVQQFYLKTIPTIDLKVYIGHIRYNITCLNDDCSQAEDTTIHLDGCFGNTCTKEFLKQQEFYLTISLENHQEETILTSPFDFLNHDYTVKYIKAGEFEIINFFLSYNIQVDQAKYFENPDIPTYFNIMQYNTSNKKKSYIISKNIFYLKNEDILEFFNPQIED